MYFIRLFSAQLAVGKTALSPMPDFAKDAGMSDKAIIILSEARSGSNWLSSLMAANKGWGVCREWLNPAIHKLPRQDRLTATALMERIARDAVSPKTNVLGMKMFTHHLMRFHQLYGFDPIQRLTTGRETLFLQLERRDRRAQAVSLEIARQTGAWKSTSPARSEPVYDFDRVLRAYMKIGASYAFWDSYLALRPVRHVRFYYEDLAEDPAAWLATCAEFTGHPIAKAKGKAVGLTVQRNARNSDWVNRFSQDLAAADLLKGLYPGDRSAARKLVDLALPRKPPRQFDL